jgi:uncharacterized lipoprotein YmbA
MLRGAPLIALLALAACGSAPVPDVAFYKMPPARTTATRTAPLVATPILVEGFAADGLYGQQAILYSLKLGGSVRAYHYQLWNNTPSRLLQRRLIRRLRDELYSPLVADRLPTKLAPTRISGVIERFERVQTPEGWIASVRIELRVDRQDGDAPLLMKSYELDVPAASDTIDATIRAFAAAIDDIYTRFVADLEALAS